MELDTLKANWKRSEGKSKSLIELQVMASVKNNPKLKRVRLKLIFESIILTLFLGSFYSIFDGNDKPLWINIVLGSSIILFILNGILGYLTLHNPIHGSNLRTSVEAFLTQLKRLSVLSVGSSSIFGISLILFLTSTIDFTQSKYVLLIGMCITLFVAIYLSYRNWAGRINHFKKVINELSLTD